MCLRTHSLQLKGTYQGSCRVDDQSGDEREHCTVEAGCQQDAVAAPHKVYQQAARESAKQGTRLGIDVHAFQAQMAGDALPKS